METGVQLVAHGGQVLFSNPSFARVLGLDPAAGPVPTLEDALAGEPAAAEAMFRLTLAARRGEARREDVILGRIPGEATGERWLRISVQPHFSAGQRLTRWTVADVTEDRTRDGDRIGQLETTLSHYRALPLGMIVAGADGQILQANEALFGRLGVKRSSDRAGTLSLTDMLAPETAELILAFARSPVTDTVRFDVELKRETGAALPVELVCRRQKTAAGKDAVFAFVVENDPNGQRPGSKSAKSGRALPRVLQGAPIGIATIDTAGNILTANTAFDRMFIEHGCRPGVSIGKLVIAETDAAAREAMELAIAKALAGRTTGAPVELAFGKNRDIVRRVYAAPVASGSDDGEAAVLYVIDATRTEGAGTQIRPEPEDGSGRQTRRRHRARLQQRADRHHRPLRLPAAEPPPDGSRLHRHAADQVERQSRRRHGAPAARLLAQADTRAGSALAQRRGPGLSPIR